MPAAPKNNIRFYVAAGTLAATIAVASGTAIFRHMTDSERHEDNGAKTYRINSFMQHFYDGTIKLDRQRELQRVEDRLLAEIRALKEDR